MANTGEANAGSWQNISNLNQYEPNVRISEARKRSPIKGEFLIYTYTYKYRTSGETCRARTHTHTSITQTNARANQTLGVHIGPRDRAQSSGLDQLTSSPEITVLNCDGGKKHFLAMHPCGHRLLNVTNTLPQNNGYIQQLQRYTASMCVVQRPSCSNRTYT